VISDLLGVGSDMQASDVIDVEGLSGLDSTMAKIYNYRGQSIEESARDLGIPTHAAAGIMKVESGGATFSQATDQTILRFENHVFWKEWGKRHQTEFNLHFDFNRKKGEKPYEGHRFRKLPTESWEVCHKNQVQEWDIVNFAAILSNTETAYKSASWGAGQIMGSNASTVGYSSAVQMVTAFNQSERSQVTGIFEFIRSRNLV
jgi:N-acetylmuramidase